MGAGFQGSPGEMRAASWWPSRAAVSQDVAPGEAARRRVGSLCIMSYSCVCIYRDSR